MCKTPVIRIAQSLAVVLVFCLGGGENTTLRKKPSKYGDVDLSRFIILMDKYGLRKKRKTNPVAKQKQPKIRAQENLE